MSILRNTNRERYTVLDNRILQNKKLSLKARGLLATLLSLPDNWNFSEVGLCKILDGDGLTSIKSGIKELILAGYLKRTRVKGDKGYFAGYDWEISEIPFNITQKNDSYPLVENHMTDKQLGYNTNKSKNKKSIATTVATHKNIVVEEGHLGKEANRLLDYFTRLYKHNLGTETTITEWGRFNAKTQKYIKLHGLELMKKVFEKYFTKDEFFEKSGYSINALLTDVAINGIIFKYNLK